MSLKPRFAPGLLTGTHTCGAPTNSDQGCGKQLQREEYSSNPAEHSGQVRSTRCITQGSQTQKPTQGHWPIYTNGANLSPSDLQTAAGLILLQGRAVTESLGDSVYPPECTPALPIARKRSFSVGSVPSSSEPPASLEEGLDVIHPFPHTLTPIVTNPSVDMPRPTASSIQCTGRMGQESHPLSHPRQEGQSSCTANLCGPQEA